MPRPATILVCLLLGTGLMLGHTLVISMWPPTRITSWGLRENEPPYTAYSHIEGWGYDCFVQSEGAFPWPEGRDWSQMHYKRLPDWTSTRAELAGLRSRRHVAVGWPWRFTVARCDVVSTSGPAGAGASSTWHHALRLGGDSVAATPEDRVLPWQVRWLPLVGSLGVWCTLAGILVMTLRVWRVTTRRLRHRCPRCAYDLRGARDPGCPECGWRRETRRKTAPAGEPGPFR